MKKKILSILITILTACMLMFTLSACGGGEPPHTHAFDKEIATSEYLSKEATCEDKAEYYYSCSCGDKGTETFKYGEKLGHAYGDWISIGNGQHKKTCANNNSHTITENCSGGNATCTQKAVCDDCGTAYGSKKSHSYTELNQSVTQHWYECSCGAYETKENHNPGASATETTDQTCTECGYIITPALGHVHTLHLTKVDAKPQSCTATGNVEYYTCSCSKWFTDNTATTEITDKSSVVIEKDAHKYETLKKTVTEHWWECSCGDKDGLEEHHGGNATCTQKAVCTDCGLEYGSLEKHNYTELKKSATQHWYECTCGAYETKENHNPGASATETTDQTCTECGYVITPAIGHVHNSHLTKVDAKPQSCTKEGNIEYYTCSCSKWFTDNTATTEITDKSSVVIEKDAHKYETLKKTATEHWWECSCGAYETKENHKGGTATCQVKATCSVCDIIYGDFAEHEPKTAWIITDTHHYHECVYGCTEKLNYKEHSFTNYVSNKDATYESDGTKTATCDGGCGKTHTVTDVGSMLIKDEIRFTTLNVNDKNVYGKVSNATTEFVFYEEIFVSGNATYVVDNDKSCSSPIDSKTVDLNVGDNTFYVLETVGNNVKLYTVTIHRREMFTVIFNTNGGTAVDNQIVEEDSFATAPTTSKTGYTFDSWDYDFNTAITGNTTINASWNAIEYEIVYNLNNGSLNTDKNKYTIEQTITFDNPTRDYYTFSGWYNNADFNGSKITKLTIGTYGDIELYAKWTPINYNITYVLNGGTNDKNNPTKYNVETSTITLNNPTRDGYTFDGWYLEETFNTKVTQIEQGSYGNVKLYAKWNIVEYDIIYNLNGGNLATDKNKYTIEQAVAFDNPTRDYYTFSGWYYNADFSGSNVDGIAVGSYGDIELYAKWTPIDYDITYVLNGGTNDKDNTSQYNVETETIIFNEPTRDGYSFDGWYLEETFDTKVNLIENGSHTNVKIYAKWYAIFMLDGGEIIGVTDQRKTLSKIIIPKKIDGIEITSIGNSAFSWCDSLISIEIPSSVTSIGNSAFKGTIIYNNEDNWENGVLYIGNYLIEARDSISGDYIIKEGTKVIADYAFCGCDSLTSVEIPDSVISIGRNAFYACYDLTNVEIGNSVISIGYEAFAACSSLKMIIIPKSVKNMGWYVFKIGTIVYCEATAVPSSWSNRWNYQDGEPYSPIKYYLYREERPEIKSKYWFYNSEGKPIIWG